MKNKQHRLPVRHWDAMYAHEGFTAAQIAQIHRVRRSFGCCMFYIRGILAGAILRYELSAVDARILAACNAAAGVRCELVPLSPRSRKLWAARVPETTYLLAA